MKKNIFKYPRCFVYASKPSYAEYEHNGLNSFLEKMYKIAMNADVLEMKDPLKAFNSAYYIAVSLYNTPYLNLCNMDHDINKSIADIFKHKASFFDYAKSEDRSFPHSLKYFFADELLVRWFVYAILYLQENKTQEMDEFLQMYVRKLNENSKLYVQLFGGMMKLDFLLKLQGIIENCEERYSTDLYPSTMMDVIDGGEWDWSDVVHRYDENTVLQFFTHFRTKEEQHRFLDWMKRYQDSYSLKPINEINEIK